MQLSFEISIFVSIIDFDTIWRPSIYWLLTIHKDKKSQSVFHVLRTHRYYVRMPNHWVAWASPSSFKSKVLQLCRRLMHGNTPLWLNALKKPKRDRLRTLRTSAYMYLQYIWEKLIYPRSLSQSFQNSPPRKGWTM